MCPSIRTVPSRDGRFVSPRSSAAGFSMVGLLVTLVCIVVLFTILMNSVNKAVTGQGSQQGGTVRSFEDKLYLNALYQSMAVNAMEGQGQYPIPSKIAGSNDSSLNTTANLFSAMVMDRYTPPNQLISGNEYSPYVGPKDDYDFLAYDAAAKRFWDSTFVADLTNYSNVSYAHLPLSGERFEKQWRSTMSSTFPLLGNRGPKDGVNDINSYACGRDGAWRGHIVFGDGHVEFVDSPTFNGLMTTVDGQMALDNIFIMETGGKGSDAVLSFTKSMTREGPELQFD